MMSQWFYHRRALRVLRYIADGALLRSHRDIEGQKVHLLHELDGTTHTIHPRTVRTLLTRGYVTSNQKFPVATLMITEKGRTAVER